MGAIASTFCDLAEALALCSRDSLIITIGSNFPKANEDKEPLAHRVWRSSFCFSFPASQCVSGAQAMPIRVLVVQLGS
ncbi:MAG: hypothetical protein KJ614_07585 [Gammaproteobacteria bacterium]|uniref:hypothetical protein n=1 Tax=Rhodoferax sp. TaxID=50421 RepID=UPI0017AE7D24|nr:hypothetical protein [Rhodoferax sp.]MBA3058093.1 hypothetical protein [Rhodoferax sp.]MBU3898774.1 hypothetical protein [Gammaproteobacteria bacterium]MBU4017823.1 hypothetical protein [Gammaproteobacteria bacterium]MBU4173250.1 hypothetical protein [Gammaproteobacteria bacterium]